MQMISKDIVLQSKADIVSIFPLGDTHIGAFNCAEGHLKKFIEYVKNSKGYWVGGGDYCQCVNPHDIRFDYDGIADWVFEGPPCKIKEKLSDIARNERKRFVEIVSPIKDKCLGLVEGNHEFSLRKYSNNGHHYVMCDELKTENLTDCAFIRLNFKLKDSKSSAIVVIWIEHGDGGGRSAGAEPNHLQREGMKVDADIVIRGHSHTFRIEPSEPHLCIPHRGVLPDECLQREVFKGNWGCWLKSYARGNSTYDSRKSYPPRPLKAMEIKIKPFHMTNERQLGRVVVQSRTIITMQECPFEF